jgi:tRNA (cmo5U34)-methyltransferase
VIGEARSRYRVRVTDWTETDSATYRDIADVAVPRRAEMLRTLVAAVPFAAVEPFRIVELGSGEGQLAVGLLEAFPRATITALDGSESMRERTGARLAPFVDRARVRPFDVAALDWWDVMFGADLVISSLCLHHLTDAKKQYLYKAAADRLSPRGALLVADLIEPTCPSALRVAADEWDANARAQADALGQPDRFERFLEAKWNHFRYPDAAERPSALLHHFVWLRHAGFAAVDCFWLHAGHAVFGGFKQSGAPPSGDRTH